MILTITLNAAVDKTHIIPDFRLGTVNRPQEILAMAGGKGINVARILHALGQPVLATGIVAGHRGGFILDSLSAEGIPHDFHRLVHGESRTCLAVVHPESDSQTEINEPGAFVSATEFQRFVRRFENLLPRASWVALSGSLPPGLGPEAYAVLMNLARAAGKPVSLDTSGSALTADLVGGADLLKPNQGEAEQLLGHPITMENLETSMERLLALGARTVALTLGPLGAAIATHTPTGPEAWYLGAPPVTVVSPIGSGDAFLAGVVAGLVRGEGLPEAARRGVAAGSANAAVAGAAMCTLAQIDSLCPAVHIRSLNVAFREVTP